MFGQIFRYAISTGRVSVKPAADLAGALPAANPVHHAAITEPKAVGALMRAIQDYKGEPITRAALRFAPLVYVRPGELRAAEWKEFDLNQATWRIPAERMKMREAHFVPLSTQAVIILRDLNSYTGNGPICISQRQLAHAERDSIRAAYNRAEHLPERKKMMQAWADYLDELGSKSSPA